MHLTINEIVIRITKWLARNILKTVMEMQLLQNFIIEYYFICI